MLPIHSVPESMIHVARLRTDNSSASFGQCPIPQIDIFVWGAEHGVYLDMTP